MKISTRIKKAENMAELLNDGLVEFRVSNDAIENYKGIEDDFHNWLLSITNCESARQEFRDSINRTEDKYDVFCKQDVFEEEELDMIMDIITISGKALEELLTLDERGEENLEFLSIYLGQYGYEVDHFNYIED